MLPGKLCIGILEEDNPLKSYFRMKPLLIEQEGKYVPFENTESGVPGFVPLGQGERYHFTGLIHNEAGFYTSDAKAVETFIHRIHDKIESNVDDIAEFEEVMLDDAEAVIIAYGAVARSAYETMEIMRKAGKKIGLLRLKTIWPFPAAAIRNYCAGKKMVVMPEMNMGQLASEVKAALGDQPFFSVTQVNGKLIAPGDIQKAIKAKAAELGVEL